MPKPTGGHKPKSHERAHPPRRCHGPALAGTLPGAGAALWVGASGVLTAFAMVVEAFLSSRGRWTIRRRPDARRSFRASSPA